MLYLKKIEMYGFKSFADKVELRFDQPITGIVGPNGCGKSNISDAIRWVLGEQSTKTLRGKVMQDLIFSGTDARKSMSYCEVSLFIDNSTRLFPIQMDEVIISRKLYRNNESEYLLNRNICRLRDIQELLRGVGLGKEGYSIVGQGRMDAILNARPEDRRAIFEEALGISSFRVKKVETERKLEKTRGNMQNIMILVEELKRRLPELKRQSTNAHKYLNLYNELRLLEINAYIYGYDHASQDKANGKKKLDGLKEQLALKERLYVEFNEQYDALFQRRNSIDDEINTLRERQLKLAVAQAENEGQQRLHQERIANLQHDIEQSEETITASQNEIDSITQAIAELDDQIAKRLQEKEQLENEILQVTENFVSLGGKLDEINSDADALRKKLEDILAAVSQYSSKLAAGNTEKDTLNQRLQEIADKEAEVSLKLKQSAGEEGNLLEQYDILRKQKDQQESDARILKQKVKELEYKQFELAKELQRRQQAFASEKGGIDMLKDFAANYRGFQVSVQYLMQDSQKDKELASHICGVVANLLKVEPKLQLAIETALGARLQNIVTLNEEDVKYLINYLKINDYGKATFLPVSSMKPHTIVRPEVLNEKGVLGVASKLVSFDKKYFTVFESLLGGIVIVDNFDNAVAISRKYGYSHRMVTLTGERINNDGSLEGGSNKKQTTTNLLGYESEIEKRTETLERLRAELNKTEQEKLALDKQLEQLRSEHAQLLDSINSLNVQIATAKEKIETSNTLSNSDKQTILGLSAEKERINTRIMEIDRAITKITAHLDELSKAEKKLRSKIDHNRETLQLESSAKDLLAQSINQKRYRLAVLANNIESAQKEKEALAHQIVSLQDAIEGKNRYIGQVRQAIDLLMEELNASTEDSALRDELTQLSQQIKQADQLRAQLEVDFQRMTDERISLSNELESIRGSIDKEEYILSKIDDDLLELQQRVQEEYGITYSAAMQYKVDDFNKDEAKARISELKQALQRLGSVNVNAIQELEETQSRYDDLLKQIDDLKKAEDDLKTALKGLTSDIQVRFEDGMTKINENFKTIFRELFNGGNARLYIDRDPNKEELDHGVEIEAQPPGKKLQNISLLSGGERTMTTAAILFAILKFNPMPFCVLDEIEAALDDANADRIAKYLRKFSASTQFVIITHKKPTMENADVLYGVTMEEKGVSKIVSVKLTEAIKDAM